MLRYCFILLTVCMLSLGQVMFKIISRDLDTSVFGLLGLCTNIKFISTLVLYFVATVMWIIAIKGVPLGIAYPFAALAFILVPFLAYFFLDEPFRFQALLGGAIIILGVFVSIV